VSSLGFLKVHKEPGDVIKAAKLWALGVFAAMVLASPVFAQPAEGGEGEAAASAATAAAWPSLISFSGAFGAAFVTIGAAYGIGKLAAAAVESMARQPEVAGTIQISMIIAAALIEGFTFFALVICMG
jgi:F-type H+-transporting ATPase subunit c